MRLELSDDAAADLDGILDFGVRTFGLEVGRAYYFSFDKAFAKLREDPRWGGTRDDVRSGLWSLSHKRHVIFYDIVDGRVMVQRILHQAMDAPLRFK